MKAISPAPHEFDANFIYSKHGLKPYFGCDSIIKQAGGSTGYLEFQDGGERWQARLRYEDSNIQHPGPTTPQGTEFALDEIREYRLHVRRHPDEDGTGEQDFTAHIAPRWPGMQGKKGDGTLTEIPVPDEVGESVNFRIQGSNIDFQRYHRLVRRGAETVGLSGYYVEYQTREGAMTNPHPASNLGDAEKYVRLHEDASGPVHSREGPMARMGHLLEHDRTGFRKLVQNDQDDNGRTLAGYYHTVTLDLQRVREAWPTHTFPKEVKHYYARFALSMDEDNPLRHPKVGASFQRSLHDEKIGVSLPELRDLENELDQAVWSVLLDSDIDISPQRGDGVFVEDSYFTVSLEDAGQVPRLDLDQIQMEQENVVIRTLARTGGLTPCEEEAIGTLLADGGQVSPTDIADRNGRHVDSVRRALRRIDGLLERGYGSVSFTSRYVAGLLHDAINDARESVSRALRTMASVDEAKRRGLDDLTSSFVAWAEAHGIDYNGGAAGARMKLRFGELESVEQARSKAIIGLRKWMDAGRDGMKYRNGQAIYTKPDGIERKVDLARLVR